MAKKRSWFNQLKRFFISDANPRSEKKDKRKIWAFGRFKTRRLASLSAPSPQDKRALNEANEEKQKCAIDKAAAIAFETPQDTTEAVWPNGSNPESSIQCKKESKELASINLYKPDPQSHQCDLEIQHLAAIKIQSAFRGYLATKALRALKGLVKLQAIIRGWAVRRQAMNTLKCLQTIVNIQSDFCSKRCDMVKETQHNEENNSQDSIEKDIKIDSNSQRRLDDTLLLNSQKRWDDSPLSREEANALFISKRVAAIKRERIREYWLNHRKSTESEQNKLTVRQRYWLEQWVDTQLAKREDFQNLDTVFSSNAKDKDEFGGRRLKLRNFQKQYQIEGLDSPVIHVPRRSFHNRKQSMGEDCALLGSPAVPTYMAATESARAKARSLSSPRLRPSNMDAYSEINSPYKHKLSPISSINSEMTCSSQISKPICLSQRSPCFKGLTGPVKSNRSMKDLRLNSDFSLPS